MAEGSDDGQEKTLDASEEKLRKAREKGDVVQSMEINTAMVYLGVMFAVMMMGGMICNNLIKVLAPMLTHPEDIGNGLLFGSTNGLTGWILGSTVLAILPFFGLPAIFVILSLIGQQAVVFSLDKVKPKLSNLSIIANAKKKYGLGGMGEFIKSIAKLLVITVIAGIFLYKEYEIMPAYAGMSAVLLPGLMAEKGIELMFYVLLGAVFIAVIDYPAKWIRHRLKMKMSVQEAKDEHKQSEGDPHHKAKRRQKAHEIVQSTMLQDVATANVVIVNPTHYAVALVWDRASGEAPKCVAKGVDHVAFRIRERATLAGVVIHSDPPCARALHATTEIGDIIPREQYAAVAAAIHYADQVSHKAKYGA